MFQYVFVQNRLMINLLLWRYNAFCLHMRCVNCETYSRTKTMSSYVGVTSYFSDISAHFIVKNQSICNPRNRIPVIWVVSVIGVSRSRGEVPWLSQLNPALCYLRRALEDRPMRERATAAGRPLRTTRAELLHARTRAFGAVFRWLACLRHRGCTEESLTRRFEAWKPWCCISQTRQTRSNTFEDARERKLYIGRRGTQQLF